MSPFTPWRKYTHFSRKNDNLNLKVNIADDGEPVLKIEDFRELGYEYLNYIGGGSFVRCEKCGRLVKQSGKNTKYCTECSTKIRLDRQKMLMRERRNQ